MNSEPPMLKLEPAAGVPPQRGSRWWRSGWVVFGSIALVLLGGVNAFVLSQRAKYVAETERLRASMTALERERADHIVSREHHKLRIALALFRRQARLEPALHLSVSVDSAAMYLERDGALLREMPVVIGPERRIGVPPDTVRLAPPLGVRTIARVLGDTDTFRLPPWVFADRGMPAPADGGLPGALGPGAVILDGGAIIYAVPSVGPLADSSYVLPGAVRARAEDLRAIAPNLRAGMRIYFY